MSAVPNQSLSASNREVFDTQGVIDGTFTDEIVIALCGPMGTPLHPVAELFARLLKGDDYKYEQVCILRLSDFIKREEKLGTDASTEELIDSGNKLRQKSGSAILAQLAIEEITLKRQEKQEAQRDLFKQSPGAVTPTAPIRICHIIDSVKNSAELKLLRSVYGDMLHVVGVYAPISLRIEQISKTNRPEQVFRLIDRDSGEELQHGQRVRDTFPQADFFLRSDTNTDSQLEGRVRRFLDLVLGVRIITPTVAERAMYAAYSAARGSACLSRQVGAAITNSDGLVLATGWNDVPKPFGGLYQNAEAGMSYDIDHRCWNKDGGKCFNDEEKKRLASVIVDRLILEKILSGEDRKIAEKAVRSDTQLGDLIEFSRAVHAEMHALLNAGASNGNSIRGGKLFVTTYPCHSCARHLVAAGIKEVYFIEPYRKSLATKLHSDAITETETDTEKVRIIPFDGVAPSRFLKLFSSPPSGRKGSDGRMKKGTGRPVTAITLEAIQTLEGLAVKGLQSERSNEQEH